MLVAAEREVATAAAVPLPLPEEDTSRWGLPAKDDEAGKQGVIGGPL